jgi:hypothetical protein
MILTMDTMAQSVTGEKAAWLGDTTVHTLQGYREAIVGSPAPDRAERLARTVTMAAPLPRPPLRTQLSFIFTIPVNISSRWLMFSSHLQPAIS